MPTIPGFNGLLDVPGSNGMSAGWMWISASHIPVARDLLLGAILWRGLLGDERFDARPWGMNVLDRVGCIRALDHRDSAQRLEARRILARKDLRYPSSLRDACQRGDGSRGDSPEMARKMTEAAHP